MMRKTLKSFGATLAILTLAAAAPAATVWINEIHYDNAGGDVNEGFEIAGVAGTDLTGWTVYLYNGSDNELYGTNDTFPLSGILGNDTNGIGFQWTGLPANGMQNGAPDGIALVDPAGTVVQFLSYEGVIGPAGDGPAIGMTSTDIGVSESSSTPIGHSLQAEGSGWQSSDFTTWGGPGANTYDAANTTQTLLYAGPSIVGNDAALAAWNANGGPILVGHGDVFSTTTVVGSDSEWKVVRNRVTGWGSDFGRVADGQNMPGFGVTGSVTYYYDTRDLTANGWEPATESLGSSAASNYPWVAVGPFQSAAGETAGWVPDSSITVLVDDGVGEDLVAGDGIFTFSFTPTVAVNAGNSNNEWKVVSNNGSGWTGETKFGTNGWSVDPGDSNNQTIPDATTTEVVVLEFDAWRGHLRTRSGGPIPVSPVISDAFTSGTTGNEVYVAFSTPAGSAPVAGDFSIDDSASATATGVTDLGGDAYLVTFNVDLSGDLTSDTLTFDNSFDSSATANLFGGIVSLGDLRNGLIAGDDLTGAPMTVSGLVIENIFDVFGGDSITIQEGTSGVVVRDTSSFDLPAAVNIGDVVLFSGDLAFFNGLAQIEAGAGLLSINDAGALPAPAALVAGTATAADYEAAESTLVTLSNVTFDDGDGVAVFAIGSSGQDYPINTADPLIRVRVDRDVEATFEAGGGELIPMTTGEVTGVLGQYDPSAPFNEGYQVLPRSFSDLNFPSSVNEWMLLND